MSPLPTPALDDRTFQDIVDEAKRLIPRYCPEWTNHNVSDPGVALIELFAWMSEMVLYRVNQVPERLYTHFLNMVGIEPFPPSVAGAPLTFWLSAVLDQPVVVPAGTEVMTVAGATERDAVVFSTVEELVIAPPVLETASVVTVADGRTLDVADGPCRGFDLGDRAAGGLRVDHPRHVDQRAQRHQHTGRLGRGQPQRVVDTGREGDLDGVAGELEVDQVTGSVAGQPAHPQLVEIVAQLFDADPEIGGGLGVGDLRVGLEVRHHVEQPHQPGTDGGHRCASRRAMTSSRSDAGSSASASAP